MPVTPAGPSSFTSSMDSFGPAPTGPLPELDDLSDDDLERLVTGSGGPPAWFEVAELLDRIRMEAAVEPDDLWVRTHVAVAAAAAQRANLAPDPTAGRQGRTLRAGAVAAATTTLIATMGLAAADTLPQPLQSVASQVAALVGVTVPDGDHGVDAPTDPGPAPAGPVDEESAPVQTPRSPAVPEDRDERHGPGRDQGAFPNDAGPGVVPSRAGGADARPEQRWPWLAGGAWSRSNQAGRVGLWGEPRVARGGAPTRTGAGTGSSSSLKAPRAGADRSVGSDRSPDGPDRWSSARVRPYVNQAPSDGRGGGSVEGPRTAPAGPVVSAMGEPDWSLEALPRPRSRRVVKDPTARTNQPRAGEARRSGQAPSVSTRRTPDDVGSNGRAKPGRERQRRTRDVPPGGPTTP